jgi:CheY-like chemotaxis protein
MPQGTFLVIEVEQPEGISTRKLVLETARHNVLTAYSGREGLHLLERFPKVDAVVVHSRIEPMGCREVIDTVKDKHPELPIVVVAPDQNYYCPQVTNVISSHNPRDLLDTLQGLLNKAA